MDERIKKIYTNFGHAEKNVFQLVEESWDETLSELQNRGIRVEILANLIEECIGNGSKPESFGHHILHKLTKAVSVVRGFSGTDRDYCMISVVGDLNQIISYASKTSVKNRSFIDCVRSNESN